MTFMRWWRILAWGPALLTCSTGVVMAHPSNHVVANGGGTVSGSGRVLNCTSGQAVVGSSLGPGNALAHGYWATGSPPVSGVNPTHAGELPQVVSFGLPQPNPVNPARDAVRFELNLPRASRVRLEIFDVAGRKIGESPVQGLEAGIHSMEWKAPPERTGVYFARLLVDGGSAGVRRMVLVK